jgi:hypothetical protein
MCHASKERVLLFGTDQRITSGPAARTAAFKGRIHGCTRTIRGNVRFFSCTAGAVHTWHIAAQSQCGGMSAAGESGLCIVFTQTGMDALGDYIGCGRVDYTFLSQQRTFSAPLTNLANFFRA